MQEGLWGAEIMIPGSAHRKGRGARRLIANCVEGAERG